MRPVCAPGVGRSEASSAILASIETDVNYAARAVRARGMKAWNRDRLAYIADWAWPFVDRHLATLLPGERIFRGIDRWKASDYHRERLRALGLAPLRLHDSRHHWAVETPACRWSWLPGSSDTVPALSC